MAGNRGTLSSLLSPRARCSPRARWTFDRLQLAFEREPAELAALNAWLGTFYPYQLEWLLDWDRFSLLLKARQIGASHVYAAASILWALLGETTTVISLGERESGEVLLKARKHANVLKRLGSKLARVRRDSNETIELASGGRVISLPQSSGARSYSGNVILDEFAYLPRPEMVWDGAAGAVTHGYKLRCLSTPNGVGNLFHQLWTTKDGTVRFRRHAVTIDQAAAQGLRVDWDYLRTQARGDDRVFDQLFRCRFLDGEQQYIPTDLINAALADDTEIFDGDCFGGLDIGRTNDKTTLYVLRVDEGNVLWSQRSYTCKRTSSDDIENMVADAFADFDMRRLCVDSTGIGAFPAERLQKIHGVHRVEPVVFTQGSKEDLATTLFQVMAERRLKVSREDKPLQMALASIKRIITSAGNVRYDAPHTDQGHADEAWSLALAVHGATRPVGQRYEQPERRF